MDIKTVFEKTDSQSAFIKTTAKLAIDGPQKATLNRKGNALYNSGDVEAARRIFQTTGYSDGLVRIGDFYSSEGRSMDALRMYWMAPDRIKADAIIVRLSVVIQGLLREEKAGTDE